MENTKTKLIENRSLHIRGVDPFQSEAVKRLEEFYDYGNQNGRYSNAELRSSKIVV